MLLDDVEEVDEVWPLVREITARVQLGVETQDGRDEANLVDGLGALALEDADRLLDPLLLLSLLKEVLHPLARLGGRKPDLRRRVAKDVAKLLRAAPHPLPVGRKVALGVGGAVRRVRCADDKIVGQ